jgi:hypothetical protein
MPKPPPRKNARRYDVDTEAKGTAIIGSRVSDELMERLQKAKPLAGVKQNSELVNLALVLFLSQVEHVAEMYHAAGILKKDEKALKAFRLMPLSPEEIEHRQRQYPEKLTGALAKYYKKTMEKLLEIETRLRAVEQAQRGGTLKGTPPDPLPPLTTDLELL